MKSAIFIVFLVAQTNAMSWAEVFSPVENSFGRLVSDVVTDIRDTIDCTILAVERVLSLDGLFETSPEYEEKCGGQSAYPATQTSDTSWSDNQYTSNQESYTQSENTGTKKQLSAEIDVSVSSVGKEIQSVISESTAKQKIQNVKDSLKNESDRLSQISAVLKKEVDKIPGEVRKKLKFDSDHISVDDVVEEVKLLFETEQSDKGSVAANEVRRVFYEVLTILNVTDIDAPLSDEEEVKLILTNIYQHSNNSVVDVEKQVSMWTKEENRRITNIKNVVINMSQDGNSSTNKTNENYSQKDVIKVINKKVHEIDNDKNKTRATQLGAVESRVATNIKTDSNISSSSITETSNSSSVSHTVTSITIHKGNKTSVEVAHNETHFSAYLPHKSEYNTSTPPTSLFMSKHGSKADLSRPLNAASTESYVQSFYHTGDITTRPPNAAGPISMEPSKDLPEEITSSFPISGAQTTVTQTDYPKTKSSEAMPLDKSNTQPNDTSSHLFTDQTIASSSEQKPQSSLQNNDAQLNATGDLFKLPTISNANISTTELSQSDDKANVMTSPSPSKIADTDATRMDPFKTQLHTVSQPDSQQGTSTKSPPNETTVTSTPAAPSPLTIITTKQPRSKQYPKNFRDLTQQILDTPKSDNYRYNDYDSSVSGKFDMGVLEQLFGPSDKAEQQEAVQNAKSIIESSLKSQDFIKNFFSRVDTESAPSVFDDSEYFDF